MDVFVLVEEELYSLGYAEYYIELKLREKQKKLPYGYKVDGLYSSLSLLRCFYTTTTINTNKKTVEKLTKPRKKN